MDEALRQRISNITSRTGARRSVAQRRWHDLSENLQHTPPTKSLRELLTEIRSATQNREAEHATQEEFTFVPFGKKTKAKDDLPA